MPEDFARNDFARSALQSREILDEFLARARALVPALRERAEEGNSQRHAPDATAADLVSGEFIRLCQPKRFGGYEQPFSTISEIVMELARGDGSQAWVADVYCEHVFMLSLFPDQAQRDVWAENPDALISASIVPQFNECRKVAGGYILNGRWPFCSGLHHSTWTLIGEAIRDEEGIARHHFFLVPKADRRDVDDWHVLGLSGTGSASTVLDNVFVPDHRVVKNADIAAGRSPGAEINKAPGYRMPIVGYTLNGLGSVTTGILAGMVEDFTKFVSAAARRPHPPPGLPNLTERLSESVMEAEAAAVIIRRSNQRNDAKLIAGTPLTEEDAATNVRDVAWANMLARRAATRMFEVSGAHGLLLPGALQRAFRDIYAAGVHRALNWDTAALRYGKMVTGQAPDLPPFR